MASATSIHIPYASECSIGFPYVVGTHTLQTELIFSEVIMGEMGAILGIDGGSGMASVTFFVSPNLQTILFLLTLYINMMLLKNWSKLASVCEQRRSDWANDCGGRDEGLHGAFVDRKSYHTLPLPL
ncbi:hypothetical protein R3P38DRAFT_2794784 [Favolaschia claudopus]|uniref:Uncharacterized protein n=1 Tax=Favolaschia claudopus TaxID=2862362 RepID=A0AAW0A8P0_9AGAR